ncbi:MAG TPA: Spx/MgsR family RNA polymerase-binding regulatory protein [Candidatus Limnocylindria bacterium]|nr:Spx/MgsR family RNA polymerase-binding regulatory protein [Candidatus Limnocylindria bacterium]
MFKVYAYAGCDTCRRALKYLEERGVKPEAVPIRERPPTMAELKRMLAIYQGQVRKLFNTAGTDYRALGLGTKLPGLSDDDALRLLAGNGNLVKRPFVLAANGEAVGFKEADWERLMPAKGEKG